MSEEICFATATELAASIRQKSLSPVEIVRAHLERIERLNPLLNAIVFPAADPLAQAREAEAAVMRGDELGPLHGVPYTLKDCIETAGLSMSLGSRLYEGYVSERDAEVYTRLKAAGGILLGKTNMPEFALWWETDNDVFGPTRNPWNPERTAGGSSGGEAAAIAAGLSPLGLGTDLGGSIRAPASLCGIVGLKPTLGRIPYTGIEPQVLHRAIHVGPMTRTVADAALAMAILAGPDDVDLYAPRVPAPDYAKLDSEPGDMRVGWSPTAGVPVQPEVRRSVAAAAAALGETGMSTEQVEIPALSDRDAGAVSRVIYTMEARRHLGSIIAGHESELTPIIRSRFVDGDTYTLDEYLDANQQWEELRLAVRDYFNRYDLFLCPTVPMTAFPHGQDEFRIEGETLVGRHTLRLTLPWDLTGSPAISVPFDWSAEGLPIGVQLVGRHFDELTLLRAARALEAAAPAARRPEVG